MYRKPYERFLDQGLRRWMFQTASRHLWRMPSWYELDDLLQDGFIAFLICKARYGERVQNKKHFMALYKRVYMSIIHGMASKRSRDPEQVTESALGLEGFMTLEDIAPGEHATAEFEMVLAQAPQAPHVQFGLQVMDDEAQAGNVLIKPPK